MKSRTIRIVALCGFIAAGIAASAALQAHHAVAGIYDLNKEIVLVGKLKKLNFVNPHAGLILSVEDKKAKKIVDWNLTTASVTNLTRQGFNKSRIKVGDPLKATVLPAINGNPAGYIRQLDLGDESFKFDIE